MADPKPIILTQSPTNPEAPLAPQPFVVVAGATAGSVGVVTKQAAIANITADPGALADLAAARTAITATNTKINAILAALRAAGIILP